MLDWPLASHTSPTRMPERVIVFEPLTVIVFAVFDVARGFSVTTHLPWAFAVVV